MAKNEKKVEPQCEVVDAPFEAYAPIALLLQDDDFVIRACDGDQEYVYIAMLKRSKYTVMEVYPGLSKLETNVREIDKQSDLTVPGKYDTIEAAVEMLRERIFEGFEFMPESQAIVRVTMTGVQPHGVPAKPLRAANA